MAEELRYYKVKAYCGHVGAGKSQLKTFAIEAESATDAIRITRSMPMVKHTHATAIKDVMEITKEEYDKLREESAYYRGEY